MRVEVAPPGGDLLLQGGDAAVVAAGKDRGGRDGGGHLGFPRRRAALRPVSHAAPVRGIPASTPACIHARHDRSTSRCPSTQPPTIGTHSWWARVCEYVSISVRAITF